MKEEGQFHFGSFRLDLPNKRLGRGKREISLPPKAFDVLQYLVEHPGRVLTKDILLEALWPKVYVSDSVLAVYIRKIRKALVDDPRKPEFIETVHRRGYRFIAAVNTGPTPAHGESRAQPVPLSSSNEKPTAAKVSDVASTIGALPLVGRKSELAFFVERLEAALQSRGSVVFITGEAGIGKTRLALEVRHYAQQKGCQWLAGKYEKSVSQPYKAWGDIVSSCLREEPSLQSLVHPYAAQLAKIVPELGTPERPATIVQGDPDTERRRLFEGLTGFLIHVSQEAPLVLFLDDLQWAPSIEPMHHLSQKIGNQRRSSRQF